MKLNSESKLFLFIVLGIMFGVFTDNLILGIVLGTTFGLVWGYSESMVIKTSRKRSKRRR